MWRSWDGQRAECGRNVRRTNGTRTRRTVDTNCSDITLKPVRLARAASTGRMAGGTIGTEAGQMADGATIGAEAEPTADENHGSRAQVPGAWAARETWPRRHRSRCRAAGLGAQGVCGGSRVGLRADETIGR
ncbi:protein of unknown function [Burkholderia multivorans]